MKKEWKNFKIDKNKVYQIIGQAMVYSIFYVAGGMFCYWGFLQGMTY